MQEQDLIWLFMPLLFLVALLYASVGHGGASGYLALMALFSFHPTLMKSSALILNVFVSFVAFIQYYKGDYFKWKLFFPFAITSIPASFIGSYILVDTTIYKLALAILLLFPIARLLGLFGKESAEIKELKFVWALIIGAVIGFFSGMIGIGGGIILSPILLLLHWANMKQTAAVSALFIFVNSLSGLAGVFIRGIEIESQLWISILVTVVGGFLGAYIARKNLNNKVLKFILAGVLTIASAKLFIVAYQ